MESNNLYLKAAPLVDLDELKTWILYEDEDLLVFNKPGWLVCHPSKQGPLSSLVGAAREYLKLDRVHIVSRLDRETSGIVVLTKNGHSASLYQKAIQDRQVKKEYLAILYGMLSEEVHVDKALGKDMNSQVYVKQAVSEAEDAKSASTTFKPISFNEAATLCSVELHTGRKHQIRAHAQFIGHSIIGDKIYGPDETLYLKFIEQGLDESMKDVLLFERQALHCYKMGFTIGGEEYRSFSAPLTQDLKDFCNRYNLSIII